ncbi:MAG: ATPase [Phycisphaerae bacterium]|nr:ATPase [Phycisphaerae bacterium]
MFGSVCAAAEGSGPEAQVQPDRGQWATAFIAVGAALSVGLCALATGLAQSRIGAAGCGAIAEKPETAGTVILLVAIPETMVILGFVVAVVLMFTL